MLSLKQRKLTLQTTHSHIISPSYKASGDYLVLLDIINQARSLPAYNIFLTLHLSGPFCPLKQQKNQNFCKCYSRQYLYLTDDWNIEFVNIFATKSIQRWNFQSILFLFNVSFYLFFQSIIKYSNMFKVTRFNI